MDKLFSFKRANSSSTEEQKSIQKDPREKSQPKPIPKANNRPQSTSIGSLGSWGAFSTSSSWGSKEGSIKTPLFGYFAKKEKNETSSDLLSEPNDLEWLKTFADKEFRTFLKSIPFPIHYLIIDPQLLPILNVLTSMKEEDTFQVRLFSVDESFESNSVFILKNRIETIDSFSKWLKKELLSKNQFSEHEFSQTFELCVVPRRTLLIEQMLEYQGLLNSHGRLSELRSFSFIPLSGGLFEMGLKESFRDYVINYDYSSLSDIARVLSYFKIRHSTVNIGKWSLMVQKIHQQFQESLNLEAIQTKENPEKILEVDQAIIIDRNLDLYSPFITSFSYDSVLDNYIGINYGRLDFSKIEKRHSYAKTQHIPLDDNDVIYDRLRYRNVSEAKDILHVISNEIRQIVEKKNALKDIDDIQSFVKQDLPLIQQQKYHLANHLDIVFKVREILDDSIIRRWMLLETEILNGVSNEKEVIDFIMERIVWKDPLPNVLRMIVLYNMLKQGFTKKAYEDIVRELIHTHGIEIMTKLNNLKRTGLFCTKNDFPSETSVMSIDGYYTKPWMKMARLLQQDMNPTDTNNLGYEFGGYTPLLIKLIELGIVEPHRIKERVGDNYRIVTYKEKQPEKRKILIFVVGGLSRAEFNCLKALERIHGCNFLVGTTSIMHGSSFIESLL